MAFPNFRPYISEVRRDTAVHRRMFWWTARLITAAAFAVLSLFCGFAIAAASLIGLIADESYMSIAGSLFLILSMLLMMLAAHCMDKVDETRKIIQEAEFRENVFTGRHLSIIPERRKRKQVSLP